VSAPALLAVLFAAPLVAPTPSPRVTAARPPKLKATGVPVARITFGEGALEHAAHGGKWKRASEGERIKTGDKVRTGPLATARIAFPWASLTLGSGSTLAVAPSPILATVLEEGRVEQSAEGSDNIKLLTPDAEVRGRGRVVVRRRGRTTFVTVVEGRAQVYAGEAKLSLESGQGCRVEAGSAPELRELPAPPRETVPGRDPKYVAGGKEVTLAWAGAASGYHVQILPIGSPEVLLARDVAASPLRVEIPWPGTFRWRVSVHDAQGNEGVPSTDGYFCMVDK
jgi:hypothetical protein